MKRFDLKYRVQEIDCCVHCKHCRQSSCDEYYCSIIDPKEGQSVSVYGICDSYKDWRK